ncbi:MAG: hypothetical protein WCV69_02210 [Patescibacteria group bacterium]|jgi:hypothetical protein
MGIKNIWSLNIDEALVADKLKQYVNKKDFEVFFPVNSQLKDIDLLLVSLKDNKAVSIQVKGSRTYEPNRTERKKFGHGSSAWFCLSKNSVFQATNKQDYYIFVLHNIIDGNVKKEIKIDYLIIPKADLYKICSLKRANGKDDYNFFVWIDEVGGRAFDFHENMDGVIQLSQYLNNWGLLN